MKSFILFTILIFSASFFTSRIMSSSLKTSVPRYVWERETTGLGETERALKEATLPIMPDETFVIGSSVTMRAKDLNRKTRNLGFYASTPLLLNAMYAKTDREEKYQVSAIEFLPQNLTIKANQTLDKTTKLRLAYLLEIDSILKNTFHNPLFWSEVLTMKLLGTTSPEINSNLFLHHLKAALHIKNQFIPYSQTEHFQLDLKRQIERYDLLDLVYDENALNEFIRLIRDAKEKSRCLVIVAPPDNTSLWTRSELGKSNLNSMISKILHETGQGIVPLDKFQKFESVHFKDATHVSPGQGEQLMNQALTEAIKQSC